MSNNNSIYTKAISNLKDAGIAYDVNILEIACNLIQLEKTKAQNYEYLKALVPNKVKTQAILHIVACIANVEHPVNSNLEHYVQAIRKGMTNSMDVE